MYRYEVTAAVKTAIENHTGKSHFYKEGLKFFINENKRNTPINYWDASTDSFPIKSLDDICWELFSTDFAAQSTEVPELEHIQKTQTYLGSNNIVLLEFGFNFIATANGDTNGDLLLPVKYLRGSGFETEDNVFGDSITVQIVDVDNVLGAGAGYVASVFGQNVQIPKGGLFTVLSESISSPIPSGLYFRVIYHSAGTVNNVKVRVNCRGYNDVI